MKRNIWILVLVLGVFSCDDGIIEPDAGNPPSGTFISQVDVRDPFKVSFSASAQNASNIFWDFGDGLGVASGATATYTYPRSGTYTVILTLINKAGIEDVKKELVIAGPETPITDFAFSINDATAPLTVNFENLSEFGATYLWEFGDGNTSTQENPTHNYTSTGKYSVRLSVTGVDGIKKTSKRREFYIINPADLAATASKQWGLSLQAPAPNATLSGYYVTNAEAQVVINSVLEDCELNDRYIFSADKIYTCENQDDARLKLTNYTCTSFTQPADQNWTLVRTSALTFSLTVGVSYIGDPAGAAAYRIINISPSRMQLEFDRDAAGGAKETVHLTLEPK